MMKKLLIIACAVMLASCGSSKTATTSNGTTVTISSKKVSVDSLLANAGQSPFKSSELLVKFKDGVPGSTSAALHNSLGSKVIKGFKNVTNLQHVKLPAGMTVTDAITKYMANPNVLYAEANYLLKPYAAPTPVIPNDTFFTPQQWALYNTGNFASGYAGADIDATSAWGITRGSNSVTIAVLDSGVDYTHPDLVGNLYTNINELPNNGIDDDGNGKIDDWRGWNFVYDDKDASGTCDRYPDNDPENDENCHDPMDDDGHGTHVAGIIGAVSNNGFGVAGLMWNVRLLPIKICLADVGGCPVDAIVDGIGYAVERQAKVANLSLGGYVHSSAIENAIIAADNAGMLLVASAGNDNFNNDITHNYPSSYLLPNIIAVASTDQNDRRSDFSNFGLSNVHVAAPGTYILSTMLQSGVSQSFISLCSGVPVAGFDFCSGTSMAAPHVSGLAGLLYSHHGDNLDNYRIRGLILRYVDLLPTLTGWIETGGRINAYRALSSILSPSGLTASASSSTSVKLEWTDNATEEDKYVIERLSGSGRFVQIGEVLNNVTSFTDTNLAPGTTYVYRVRAFSWVPFYPNANMLDAQSAPSNEVSVTTPGSSTPTGGGSSSSGGGGGCSMAHRHGSAASYADAAVIMMPLLVIAVLRGMRRRKK